MSDNHSLKRISTVISTTAILLLAFSALWAGPASADAAADANKPDGNQLIIDHWPSCSDTGVNQQSPQCIDAGGNLVVRDKALACTRFKTLGMANYCSNPANLTDLPDVPPACATNDSFDDSALPSVCREESQIRYVCDTELNAYMISIGEAGVCTWGNDDYHNIADYQQNVLLRATVAPPLAQPKSLSESQSLKDITNGLGWYALLMCLLGVLISCSFWAIGYKGQNAGTELNGKKGLIVCLTAAFFIGAAPHLINWLVGVASLPDVDKVGLNNAAVSSNP